MWQKARWKTARKRWSRWRAGGRASYRGGGGLQLLDSRIVPNDASSAQLTGYLLLIREPLGHRDASGVQSAFGLHITQRCDLCDRTASCCHGTRIEMLPAKRKWVGSQIGTFGGQWQVQGSLQCFWGNKLSTTFTWHHPQQCWLWEKGRLILFFAKNQRGF